MIGATVMITTYNRPRSFNALVEAIHAQEPKTRIVVINDGSNTKGYNFDGCEYLENKSNQGKERYYDTVNKLWAQALKVATPYYYMLPDDIMIGNDFFAKSVRLYESIKDHRRICLTLFNQGWESCWTGFKRKTYADNIDLTQWCDLLFISNASFINYVIPAINPKIWQHTPLLGSQVGREVSMHWYKKGFNLYSVQRSLISHQPEQDNSVMNPAARQRHPAKLL